MNKLQSIIHNSHSFLHVKEAPSESQTQAVAPRICLHRKSGNLFEKKDIRKTSNYLSALAAIRATSLSDTTARRRLMSTFGSTGPSNLAKENNIIRIIYETQVLD
jgi:hypothetical protein